MFYRFVEHDRGAAGVSAMCDKFALSRDELQHLLALVIGVSVRY